MNTVKSDIVYSPQAFLEDLLGECYFFRLEKTIREQVDKLIKANGKEPISFSLSDTEKALLMAVISRLTGGIFPITDGMRYR